MSEDKNLADVVSSEDNNLADIVSAYTNIAFRDLADMALEEPGVFDELYYNRETEFTRFKNIMNDARYTGVNVLVKGQAGTGKSNFVYKFLRDSESLQELALHPIMIDYRVVVPSNASGCLVSFLKEMVKYFQVIGHPINTLSELTEENVTYNIQECHRHLQEIPGKPSLHLMIVLDDFDYAEGEWFKLLDFFLGFAASQRVSVVFTLRPLLLATVEAYDDRFNHYYNRDCQLIDLKPIDVPRVLAIRLAMLLNSKTDATLYGRIVKRIKKAAKDFKSLLEQQGISDDSLSLPSLEYPFTEKHNNFMFRITNGNLREIFDIATDSLIYMLDNKTEVTPRIEGNVKRLSIGREGDLKLFMDDYPKKKSPFRLIDLHKIKSRAGNSLYFNVLEMVKLRGIVDDTFFSILLDLAHKKNDVNHALTFLSSRAQRLISPKRLKHHSTDTHEVPEYEIMDKGDYYLQICEWPEYTFRCGESARSAKELL